MGLDKIKKTPCGFCFVEYYTRADAEDCMRYINGTRLDDRIIRCDWDAGFVEGRQYGRGKTGGQVTKLLVFYYMNYLFSSNNCKIFQSESATSNSQYWRFIDGSPGHGSLGKGRLNYCSFNLALKASMLGAVTTASDSSFHSDIVLGKKEFL